MTTDNSQLLEAVKKAQKLTPYSIIQEVFQNVYIISIPKKKKSPLELESLEVKSFYLNCRGSF